MQYLAPMQPQQPQPVYLQPQVFQEPYHRPQVVMAPRPAVLAPRPAPAAARPVFVPDLLASLLQSGVISESEKVSVPQNVPSAPPSPSPQGQGATGSSAMLPPPPLKRRKPFRSVDFQPERLKVRVMPGLKSSGVCRFVGNRCLGRARGKWVVRI